MLLAVREGGRWAVQACPLHGCSCASMKESIVDLAALMWLAKGLKRPWKDAGLTEMNSACVCV